MEITSKASFLLSFRTFTSDIKLAHTLFALPFVFATFVFIQFQWHIQSLVWILLCMVSARSFAMGMNRYLDRKVDAINPRTQRRMIPNGKLSAQAGLSWSLFFGAFFVFCAFQLNNSAGLLSPLVLVILGCYPLMKHLSWLTHWYLGGCLGLSPLATSIALTGKLSLEVCLLGLAITMWTAGFDILYALQDWQFDHKHALKSVPTRFGVQNSLQISRICFCFMVLILTSIGILRTSGYLYFLGTAIIGCILFWEHWTIRNPNPSIIASKMNAVFFNANACVSLLYFAFTQLDAIVLK